MSRLFHYLGNPARLERILKATRPYLGVLGAIALIAGCVWGLFLAPADWQQGDSARIMYVHVPMAWLASSLYLGIGVCSACYLIWKNPLSAIIAAEIAPVGALCAALCLASGSIWGQPTWGTWWVWDARLTSMLILFFLYAGFIAVSKTVQNAATNYAVASLTALVGLIDLPIIKFSVQWWNTLHQGPSIRLSGVTMPWDMLAPLLISTLGFTLWALWIIGLRVSCAIMNKRALQTLLRA